MVAVTGSVGNVKNEVVDGDAVGEGCVMRMMSVPPPGGFEFVSLVSAGNQIVHFWTAKHRLTYKNLRNEARMNLVQSMLHDGTREWHPSNKEVVYVIQCL